MLDIEDGLLKTEKQNVRNYEWHGRSAMLVELVTSTVIIGGAVGALIGGGFFKDADDDFIKKVEHRIECIIHLHDVHRKLLEHVFVTPIGPEKRLLLRIHFVECGLSGLNSVIQDKYLNSDINIRKGFSIVSYLLQAVKQMSEPNGISDSKTANSWLQRIMKDPHLEPESEDKL
ncbi:18485_t:CDS:2, partial [Dentiscutata erythropus]